MHKLRCFLALCLLLLAGCASTPDRGDALREAQYAWSAAIRWGDFEGAWTLVDPAWRAEHPLTNLVLERFKQVQVTGYEVKDREIGADGSVTQTVEIRVVNRNTQVERSFIDHQRWRFDPASKRLWLTSGLPDLSQR